MVERCLIATLTQTFLRVPPRNLRVLCWSGACAECEYRSPATCEKRFGAAFDVVGHFNRAHGTRLALATTNGPVCP